MFLYFDSQGNLKEQINNDIPRVGASGINEICVYWENQPNNAKLTYQFFLQDGTSTGEIDGTLTPEIVDDVSVENAEIPYDKKQDLKFFQYFKTYKFYTFNIPDDVLRDSGAVMCYVKFIVGNTITPMGAFAFQVNGLGNVEKTDYISIAQWNMLLKKLEDIGGGIKTVSINDGTQLQPENGNVNLPITKDTVGLGNVDNTSDANKPISNATQQALNGKVSDVKVNNVSVVQLDNGQKVAFITLQTNLSQNSNNAPTTTAVRDFVNQAIQQNIARYLTYNTNRDAFPTRQALLNAQTYYYGGEVVTPLNNDYAIVLSDETQDNATTRYVYENDGWSFQYIVENSPLTQDQLNALNSGITAELVAQIGQGGDYDNLLNKPIINSDMNFTEEPPINTFYRYTGETTGGELGFTNGHIYFWNGYNFIDITQAGEIADGSISYDKLNDALKEDIYWAKLTLLQGEGAPPNNYSIPSNKGDLYRDTLTGDVYTCIDANVPFGEWDMLVRYSKKDEFVKSGITNNALTLTDDEKTSACEWVGALKKVESADTYNRKRVYAVNGKGTAQEMIIIGGAGGIQLTNSSSMLDAPALTTFINRGTEVTYTPKGYIDNLPDYLTLTEEQKAKWKAWIQNVLS